MAARGFLRALRARSLATAVVNAGRRPPPPHRRTLASSADSAGLKAAASRWQLPDPGALRFSRALVWDGNSRCSHAALKWIKFHHRWRRERHGRNVWPNCCLQLVGSGQGARGRVPCCSGKRQGARRAPGPAAGWCVDSCRDGPAGHCSRLPRLLT